MPISFDNRNVQPLGRRSDRFSRRNRFILFPLLSILYASLACAGEPLNPEATLRMLVQANAERDLATMSKYMSHDTDAIGYTIDGRKYVGWPEFETDMRSEFDSVVKLEIPITNLRSWSKGDIAWFAMELDYVRYTNLDDLTQRMVLPLRETGVLERRDGRWILVAWHESTRHHDTGTRSAAVDSASLLHRASDNQTTATDGADLSGEWEVLEIEDNKTYRATLDAQGNGPYTWQEGRFSTTSFNDRRWQGTWKQTGNDREGAFEIVLSEDGTQAKGIWWYVRVGTRNNIPPRQHGGSYLWKRLTPPPATP
jgi:hypothetical protein